MFEKRKSHTRLNEQTTIRIIKFSYVVILRGIPDLQFWVDVVIPCFGRRYIHVLPLEDDLKTKSAVRVTWATDDRVVLSDDGPWRWRKQHGHRQGSAVVRERQCERRSRLREQLHRAG